MLFGGQATPAAVKRGPKRSATAGPNSPSRSATDFGDPNLIPIILAATTTRGQNRTPHAATSAAAPAITVSLRVFTRATCRNLRSCGRVVDPPAARFV
jgi:hypothetical protein